MSSVGVRSTAPRAKEGLFWGHFRGNPEPGIASNRGRPSIPINSCVVRVLSGHIYAGWRTSLRSYYETIQEIEAYEARVKSGEKNIQVVINTCCLDFLTKEWAKRATIVFIAPTDHAVCINHLLDGTHKRYKNKYRNYSKFTELALSGKLD